MPATGALLDQLAQELAARGVQPVAGQRHTQPTGHADHLNYTGPNSLFGAMGIERDVISTRIIPRGIATMLPTRPTQVMNPLFPYITGFLAPTGTDPDGPCDDAMTAGPGKGCLQMAGWGRYEFQTREMELNAVGRQINRGEFQDLQVVNGPLLAGTGSITTPTVPGNPSLYDEPKMRLMEVGIAFQDKFAKQLYYGNPANNKAGGGYLEVTGLDILIGTGKRDALTGVACPTLDSSIQDFHNGRIDANAETIVNLMVYQLRRLRDIADRTNLSPVRWVLAMRPGLFYELSGAWPCAYLTYRCAFTTTDGARVLNIDAGDQIAMRDAMRSGKYLLVDGERWDVVLDDAIEEVEVTPGLFSSDIYILPITYVGGRAALFWQHYDQSNGSMAAATEWRYSDDFWSDNGIFFWHKKPAKNFCVQLIAKVEPQLILRTPHLAGRLLNVAYRSLIHTRDAYAGEGYFVNGGVSTGRLGPSLYNEWS